MGSTVNSIVNVIATAVVIAYAPGLLLTGTAFWTSVAVLTTTAVVASALTVKPKARNSSLQQKSFSQETSNRSLMVRQPIIPRDMVYGETKKSGGILFMETSDNNKYIHLIVQLASHEIQSVEEVYFDEKELTLSSSGNDANGIARYNVTSPTTFNTNSKFDDGKKTVRIKYHLGTDTQVADADLVAESDKWTTAHRLQGIAYIYVRLAYDPDVFPNGLPNVSAVIRGKKVLDVRDSSTVYSKNPALILYDYLTDTKLGLGVATSNMDSTSFTTMANLCDENVNLSAGGTEKRYEAHGIIYSDIAPMEIIDDILSSCVGTLAYSNGKFMMKGGQYVSPALSLDEDNFTGKINLVAKQSRKDMFNTVKGIFTSNESNWQPTDYPMVTSSTFSDADGEVIYADVDLPFTKSSTMAQRIAKIVLFKNRQQMQLSCKVSMKGFTLQVGDTVNISNTRLGFTNKVFEVADWSFSLGQEMFIDLVLKETASSVYDWSAEETVFSLDNTTLPSSTDVSAPSISATDELRAYTETPITVLIVTCESSQGTTNEFEVEAQNSTASGDYISLGKSKNNIFELVNAQDGATYNIRARSVNAFNVYSAYETIEHIVVGKTAPPSDVNNFSVNIINGMAELSWTPISDLDLSHYVVRHTTDTASPTFEEGMILAEKVSKPASTVSLPAKTGTYMIKAIDVLGIESLTSTKSVVILNQIDYNFNVVETSTQSPNFSAGTKSEVDVVTRESVNYLQLLTGELFDDASGNFDSQSGNFDDGGDTASNVEGYYDFPVLDVGGIFTSRVTTNVGFTRFDSTTLFDNFSGNFDAREGLFDGSYTEFNDVNVEMLIATSNDNSTYTDYRSYILGDYKARYFKLRAKLTTDTFTSAPSIHTLSATVDMPDRTDALGNISSGTAGGGKVITYSPAFKSVQALGISSDNLSTGDYYTITSKSATGFTVTFRNSSGTVIDRTFDYVAKGYGYLESS